MKTNISICLVAYSQRFDETLAYRSLLKLPTSIKNQLQLLIFDNGTSDYSEISLENSFAAASYRFNQGEERGTRIAYQTAFEELSTPWLLLLDDDSQLDEVYFECLFTQLEQADHKGIQAFCPLVFEGDKQISPTASDTLAMLNHPKESGFYTENLTGIASGLCLSRSFLQEINGFTKEFPLDYLDHWLFHQLTSGHQKIAVLDVKIHHQLSVEHMADLSSKRFKSIFSSEYYFYKAYKPEQLGQLRLKYVKMIIKALFHKKLGIDWKILLSILLGRQDQGKI